MWSSGLDGPTNCSRSRARSKPLAGTLPMLPEMWEIHLLPRRLSIRRRRNLAGLDGAFNNAGMVGDMGPVTEMKDQTWSDVIQTNLTSAFLSTRAQIPALVKQGGGALVYTGSFVGVGNGGMPGMAAYAASKAGLMGLVQSLAIDWAGQGIRVNAVLPGGTRTAMAGDDPDTIDFVAGLHPMKRLATPEEIARAALFLLSDDASFVTGAPLIADGGMSVRML